MSAPAAGTIVQVTNWNSSYLGSFMTSELALAEAVRARFGLSTHFVLAEGGGDEPWTAELDAAGVSWSVIPPGSGAAREHLRRLLVERDGRLIHAHFTAGDLAAADAARSAGVPCVWHVHTGFLGYSLRQRVKDLWKIRHVARRSVDRVIVLGPTLAELVRRRGVPAQDVVMIPNAIALERFAELPSRAAARERLGIDPAATVALALGWWPEVKGVDLVLDALAALAAAADAAAPAVTGLLVGEDKMYAFVDERLGGEDPDWLVRSRFVSDPAWLYAAADLFVSASRHEGQSFAAGEALACGLPVVLSDIPGTKLYEQAAGTTTFASGDAGGLAAAIARLAGMGEVERAAAGEANRAWAQAHLSMQRWCDDVCAVYEELLAI
jgi:glycosyltransferase involved in cell wall biosynthesis